MGTRPGIGPPDVVGLYTASTRSHSPSTREVLLCVSEVRRRIGSKSAPHDNVGLVVLDRLPCPQHTFASEAAASCDSLRRLVLEVGDELNPDNVMISKGPLGHEVQRLARDAPTPGSAVEPVEGLGTTGDKVVLNPYLTGAFG